MSTYILDTNVLIEAKNRYYAFEFCPAFWNWLVEQHQRGKVFSVSSVGKELARRKDELSKWAKERGGTFFLRPDNNVLETYMEVTYWAESSGYSENAVRAFQYGADSWLVAHALTYKCVIVTHEIKAATRRKIKIPNACEELGLVSEDYCINTFALLHREEARFVLRQKPDPGMVRLPLRG